MHPSSPLPEDAVALVVHSRPYPASCILTELMRSRMTVTVRELGPEGIELANQLRPDVVVLAIDPAREADHRYTRLVAKSGSFLILLAPRFDAAAISEALMAGADAWILDDDCEELFGPQLSAIRRRLDPRAPAARREGDVLMSGPLRMDLRSYHATVGGEPVVFTRLEFRIMAHLVENEGLAASPHDILRAAQESDYSAQQARDLLKVHIRRIRLKLAGLLPDELIETVRGVGYVYQRPGLGRLAGRGARPGRAATSQDPISAR